jgi:ribosomal protein S18 acetylase RimI-like enzyme
MLVSQFVNFLILPIPHSPNVNTYLFPDRSEYQLTIGGMIDAASLVKFLQLTYQELYPQQQHYQHLQITVDRYLSHETPLWFVTRSEQNSVAKIGCLWLGIAIDQVNGLRHPNIMTIYVDPQHRRQGIGKALVEHAEAWAKTQGYTQMGLQVFTTNQPAIELYQQLGYQARSISMMREF